ncbi:MAG: PA2928 family protein [Chitinophagales bacterium]
MTFYQRKRSFSIGAVIILFVLLGAGVILFFGLRTCKNAGFMRSNKTSNATDLYQVWPDHTNGKTTCISIEGIFHTTIYEQNGGITQRSGSTDIRISIHDLASGELIARETLGNYSDGMTRILGLHENTIWLYDPAQGLYARDKNDLHILLEQKDILAKNAALRSGLAQATKFLTNLDELYAYDAATNALMVTTVSGKQYWIDASTFAEVTKPEEADRMRGLMDHPEKIIEDMITNGDYDPDQLQKEIISMMSDMMSVGRMEVLSASVTLENKCRLAFTGNTMTNLEVTHCPDSISYGSYSCIIGNFLTNGIDIVAPQSTSFKKERPVTFMEKPDQMYILHKDKISGDAHDVVSCVDMKTGSTIWDSDQFPLLNMTGELEKIYTLQNQLILIWKIEPRLDNYYVCISFNAQTGAVNWKYTF